MRKLIPLLLLAACSAASSVDSSLDSDAKATVFALHNVMSGPPGRHDWDRMKELFAPGATVTLNGTRYSVDDYVAQIKSNLETNGQFEQPACSVSGSGAEARATCTFEKRHRANDDAPFGSGRETFVLTRGDASQPYKIASLERSE
ncbi:MAG TPA: hypothetical protein VF824_05090 [Thermoanaerobaculia bacterium]|jgi:hypothetical protein